MFYFGDDVDQDYAKAFNWFQKAAAQGYAGAQCNLGLMYQNGEGVAKDLIKAADWYEMAAAQGNAYAQFNLGLMYQNGEGVASHYETSQVLRQAICHFNQQSTPKASGTDIV